MKLQYLQHPLPSPLQRLDDPRWEARDVALWIKRDDLLAPSPNDPLCGNKWRKLQYNLQRAREEGYEQLLTFGGAYSNHLAAVASAGSHFGFRTIGVVRGEEAVQNPTLERAQQNGMQLHFIDRSSYRQKQDPTFLQNLTERFGPSYILPEGGTNKDAFAGCAQLAQEILTEHPTQPTHLAVACGTGGTAAGLINGLTGTAELIGVSVLKGNFMRKEINRHLEQLPETATRWTTLDDYHHGGYARRSPALDNFIQHFHHEHGIILEPIYTGKLFFALYDLLEQGYFPEGSQVVAIHTGGLQAFASRLDRSR